MEESGSDHDAGRALRTIEAIVSLRRERLAEAISTHLGVTDAAAIAWIQDEVDWSHLRAGDLLFAEGETARSAYLVLSGRLRVVTDENGIETFKGEIGSGELVGEMALIDDAPRNATVRAIRDCDLAEIPRPVFERITHDHPKVMLEMVRTIIHRTRSPLARRSSAGQLSVALVPVAADLDVRAFVTSFAEDLRRIGETAHLWSARVDSSLGEPDIAQSQAHEPGHLVLSTWIQEIEHRSRFVVYEVDRDLTPWTRRALHQADVVMFLGDSSDDPAPTAWELAVRELMRTMSPRRRDLVLLHEPTTERPSGTARWLEHRDVDDVFHLRRDSRSDAMRLARIVGGTATGLVLSGGGARGFAHLGVVRALMEQGIEIDLIGGSSMGAAMGIWPALGLQPHEMVDLASRQFKDLLDYTIPIVAMIKGERIMRAITETLGDMGIEDLWRPYFCMSTNLTRSIPVMHRRGHLGRSIRASVAIPGVIPPVPDDGDLLVDGGVLNNLPVDEMRQLNPTGTVIAVDVAPKAGPRAKEDFGLSVSGTRELLKKIKRGSAPQAPGIVRTFLRSMLVGAMRERDRHQSEGTVDLYLDLDLRGVDLLAFDSVAEVAAKGYELAAPRIRTWIEEQAQAMGEARA